MDTRREEQNKVVAVQLVPLPLCGILFAAYCSNDPVGKARSFGKNGPASQEYLRRLGSFFEKKGVGICHQCLDDRRPHVDCKKSSNTDVISPSVI